MLTRAPQSGRISMPNFRSSCAAIASAVARSSTTIEEHREYPAPATSDVPKVFGFNAGPDPSGVDSCMNTCPRQQVPEHLDEKQG